MVTKIMPLGASNTYGMYQDPTSPGGYRGPLYNRLLQQGRDFDFVGLDSDGNIPDSDHNGYSGKPIDWFTGPVNEALYDSNGTYNITISTGTQPAIHYFIEQAGLTSTDVILLLLGTNDVRLGDSAATMLIEMETLLRLIITHPASPQVQLMFLQHVGGDYWQETNNDPATTNNMTIDAFNAGLVDLVARLNTEFEGNSGITLVDSGFTQSDLSSDGVHLNEAGYQKVAKAWSDSLAATQQVDVLSGIVLSGTAGADLLEGSDRDDVLNGYGGNDTLRGLGGNDKLAGGDGDDALYGDAGHDTLNGQAGHDRLFGGDGNDLLNGGAGNDRLEGDAGSDDLRDGAGNDIQLGGNGNDTLQLGLGDDTVDGEAGIDWLRISGAATSTVDLAITTKTQRTGYGTDTIRNIENVSGGSGVDKLYGEGGANVLHGNAGEDFLYGRAGADILWGGLGKDTMYGGAGDGAPDVFVFASVNESVVGRDRDVIYEFKPHAGPNDATGDAIDLRGIDANVGVAGDQSFSFNGTVAEAYSVWYAKGRSEVIVAGDVNGDKIADFEIRVAGLTALTADDILA